MKSSVRFVVIALLALLAPAAFAFQNPPAQEPMTGPLSQLINVPQLVENYARFLARKYNLDETQEKATVDILQKRSQEFLTNHEAKIFELYNSMLVVRGGGDMSQNELMDWGKSAMPIYQDAKEIIIGGNGEWRKLLNDQQRAIVDFLAADLPGFGHAQGKLLDRLSVGGRHDQHCNLAALAPFEGGKRLGQLRDIAI